LKWTAPRGKRHAKRYSVYRNGRRIAQTKHRSYVDHTVVAGKTYRYSVRGVDAHRKNGTLSAALRVVVPKKKKTPPHVSPGTSVPVAKLPPVVPKTPTPSAPTSSALSMSTAMVDRLLWRAGFGPSAAHRATWTGRKVGDLVDWLLDTPPTLAPTTTPPLTSANLPIDPLASDDELITEWLDRMQRADNPLPERLAFFWHRHWAVSRDSGIPPEWLVMYRDRLRSFADLPGNPNLSFRTIALDMTTKDGAMSYFLTSNQNRKGSPNENYAREFMELFCLGTVGSDGSANYTQADVQELARAFTGWLLDQAPTSATYGQVSFGGASYFDAKNKTIFGKTGPFTAAQAVDLVLAHPSHAQFIVRKLWAEFITGPIPQGSLDALVVAYTAGGALKLRPVLRGILTDPLIFDSLDEPNFIKPPVVYAVGVLRQLGCPMKAYWIPQALSAMQQRPYHPPNVAGWEGGLAWVNSNTVQARFDLLVRAQHLMYRGGAATSYPGGVVPADIPGETAQAAFDRAFASASQPWLSAGAKTSLLAYATGAPVATAAQRRQRFYTLQALMLGGPDGQVM
jgi:uncharacterized protein (DUF1800 family)